MDFHDQVSELNGYLKLLQRLCKKRSDYGVTVIDIGSDINLSAKKFTSQFEDIVEYNGSEKISFNDFKDILREYIYSNLIIAHEDTVKIIDWDIIEYFGVASTTKNCDGDFNPLVSNGCWKLNVTSDFYEDSTILLVEYDKQAILLSLGIRQ